MLKNNTFLGKNLYPDQKLSFYWTACSEQHQLQQELLSKYSKQNKKY